MAKNEWGDELVSTGGGSDWGDEPVSDAASPADSGGGFSLSDSARQDLPAGVTPSTAGAGRGNAGLSDYRAKEAAQTAAPARAAWEDHADQLMADTAGSDPSGVSVLQKQGMGEQSPSARLALGAGPLSQRGVDQARNVAVGRATSADPAINRAAASIQRGADASVQRVNTPEIKRMAQRQTADEWRSVGEWANDSAAAMASGAVSMVQLPVNIIAPGSALHESLVKSQKNLQDFESEPMKARRAQLAERVKSEDGFLDQYAATVSELVTNPSVAIHETLKQAAMFAGVLGAAKVGGAVGQGAVTVAGRASPTLALGEAISGGAIGASAAGIGSTAGGIGASSVMAAGDAAGNAYDKLMSAPQSMWDQSEDYQRLIAKGMDPQQAKQEVSTAKAHTAAMIAAPLGVLGFMGAEASFAGKAAARGTPLRTFATEMVTEPVEEALTQVAGNYAVQTINPEQDIAEGAGEAAGMATVTSGPFATAGAINEVRRPVDRTPQIEALRKTGDETAAALLERRQNTEMAAFTTERETEALADFGPDLQQRYRDTRMAGAKTGDAVVQTAARWNFEQAAQLAGLSPKAQEAISNKLAEVPAEKAAGFVQKAITGLVNAGQAQPFDGLETLAQTIETQRDQMLDSVLATMNDIESLEQQDAPQEAAPAAVDPAAAEAPGLGGAGVDGVDQPGAVPALNTEWQQFPEQTGTLNVPRAEMPQVKTAHRGPLTNFLNARGVTHEQVEVDPAELKPTQAEFSQTKVQEAADRDTDRSILISADGHIIDGHHQAIAKLQNGKPVRAIRLNATAADLIPLVREFPSSTTEQANVQNAAPGTEAQAAAAPVEAPAPAGINAAAAAGLPAAPGAGDVQADGVNLLGQNSQPLSEGGKPFKTELAARKEKKLHPDKRVVKSPDGKGFILKPMSAKQIAAQEAAARRIRGADTGDKGPLSAHGFILARGGLAKSSMSDAGFDKNVRIGNRWLFTDSGKTLAQAGQDLKEAGFITDETENAASDIIRRSIASPQYTAEGWEAVAEAEAQTRFEDHLKAQQESEEDLFASLADDGYTAEDTEGTGFDQASPEIQAEVAALSAQLEAMGEDSESILERVALQYPDATQQEYHEHVKAAITAAVAEAAQPSGRGDPGQDDGEQGQAREGTGESLTDRPDGTLSVRGDTKALRERLTAADIPAKSILPSATGVVVGRTQAQKAREVLTQTLTAPTKSDIEAQQERVSRADELDARAQVKRESEAGADSFTLTVEDGRQDTTQPMFSRSTKDQETRNLVAMHNLTAENLLYADSMGGIPVPSIGITKIDTPFNGFGEVTLIAPSSMVDPEQGTPVFDRDAWTARFPKMNFKKVKAKVADAFYERMKSARQMGDDGDSFTSLLWEQLRNASMQSPDKVADLFRRYNAAKLFYAKEVLGKDIKVPMKSAPLSSPAANDKQLQAYWKKNGQRLVEIDRELSGFEFSNSPEYKAFIAEVEGAVRRYAESTGRPERADSYVSMFLPDGSLGPGGFRNLKDDFDKVGEKVVDGIKFNELIRKAIPDNDPAYQRWVNSLVEPLFEPPTITVRGKEVAPTLDNIVESMTIGATQGAEKSLTFGPGKTAAMLGKRFKSMAEIKAARDQVVSQAAEAEGKKSTEALLDQYRAKAAEFFTQKDWRGNIDTWAANDASMEALAKAGKSGGSDSDIRQSMSRMGFKGVDQTTIDLARESIKALRNAATDYFEAKPQRSVKLSEFRAAVIPKGASQDVKDVLAKNGIEVVEYNKKIDGARDAAIQKTAKRVDKAERDVLFSRSTDPLAILSETDDLYSMPKSDKDTIEGITADHDSEIKVRKTDLPGNETMYTLTMPDGTPARITVRKSGPGSVYGAETDADNNTTWETGRPGENPEDVPDDMEDVWIDVSNLKPGQNGARVYNIAATFAHNTGRMFIGDPAGLSDEAMRRRAEHMLSSALKFGTTRHLAPHPRQTEGATGLGIPALKWVYGDDVGNIQRLAELNVKALDSVFPEASAITYDPESGTFSADDKKRLDPAGVKDLFSGGPIADRRGAGRRAAFAGAGWRTIARGAVFRSLLRGRGTGSDGAGRAGAGEGLLDQLVRQRAQLASASKDGRIFYSRPLTAELFRQMTTPMQRGMKTADLQKAIAPVLKRWENGPNVTVVATTKDLPMPAPGDVHGVYFGGKVYLVAQNIRDKAKAMEVLTHEAIAHHGLREMLGKDDWKKFMGNIQLALKTGNKPLAAIRKDVRAAYVDGAGKFNLSEMQEADEIAAKVVEQAVDADGNFRPGFGFVKSVYAKVVEFLRSIGIDVKMTHAELQGALVNAQRFLEAGKKAGSAREAKEPVFMREDQTQTPTFRAWFGGSKVVDSAGKPLVVYHGTAADFDSFDNAKTGANDRGMWGRGHYFAASAESANSYALRQGDGARVITAYVSIKNPLVLKTGGDLVTRLPGGTNVKELVGQNLDGAKVKAMALAGGHDGVIQYRPNGLIGDVVAYSPEQIKSATGNRGTFDPQNPDIRFSRTAKAPASIEAEKAAGAAKPAQAEMFQPGFWDAPQETRLDNIVYELQDGRIDLKRVQEAITKVNTIPEKFDARLQETLYPGRVATRAKQFLDDEAKPLLDAMARNNVTMVELADYLHARHAEERNKQIAKVNPDLPDGGAGKNSKGVLMTTEAAKQHIAGLSEGKRMVLTAMAKRVDAITQGTTKLLVDEGLEKQETIDAWTGAYKSYVPLFRDEAENGNPHPTGSGMSVRGGSSKRAVGSTKQATNILAHVLMQREAAITRAEKNRVAVALYGLALTNPNPDFWTTIKPGMSPEAIGRELQRMGVDPTVAEAGMMGVPTIKTVDPTLGRVVSRPNPMYKSLPGAIVLKVNGEDRVLMVNVNDPRGLRMAENLKNMDGLTKFDIAGSIVGKTTRWLASVNTQYNPAFGLVNLTRDTLGGAINLSSTKLRGKTLKVLAMTPGALKGIGLELSGKKSGEWGRLFRQFQQDGGQTGYREMFKDANDRAKALEAELKAMEKAGKLTTDKVAGKVLGALDIFNTTLENAVRLAAYREALQEGMSRPEAARLGRELTVDFNRKGRMGRELGPLYAFFNASVQGSARTLQTLAGPDGAKIIAGGVSLGVLQALMLLAAGYDDDEIPEFVKSRALIIPLGTDDEGKKRYFTIPLPLGLHVLPNTGRVLAELTMDGGKDALTKGFEAAGEIAGAFNPLGGGSMIKFDQNGQIEVVNSVLKNLSPTVTDWALELTWNQNFAGTAIEREGYGNDPRPGFERAREGTLRAPTGQAYLEISRILNKVSGGDEYEAGRVSPTPEMVRYLAQVVGGGLLREIEKTVNTSIAMSKGEDTKPTGLPVFGRFYGEVDDASVQRSRYYDNLTAIEKAEKLIRAAEKKGDLDAADRIEADKPEAMLKKEKNRSVKDLRELNKEAMETVGDSEAIKALDEERTAVMRELNEAATEIDAPRRDATLGAKLRKSLAAAP